MAHNTRHMTCDMGQMVRGEHSLQISTPKLLRFGRDSVLKDNRLNGLIHDKGGCRTAPATLGLLISNNAVHQTAPAITIPLTIHKPLADIVLSDTEDVTHDSHTSAPTTLHCTEEALNCTGETLHWRIIALTKYYSEEALHWRSTAPEKHCTGEALHWRSTACPAALMLLCIHCVPLHWVMFAPHSTPCTYTCLTPALLHFYTILYYCASKLHQRQ